MTRHGRSLRPHRQSNRHSRPHRKTTKSETIEEQRKEPMTQEYFTMADQEAAEVRSVIDDLGDVLGSEATLVEDDSGVEDDFEELPLEEVYTPLSDAQTVVDDDENGDSPILSIRRAGVYRHPNHPSRRIPSDPPPLDNALGLDLGPPISFHPFDSLLEFSADTQNIEPPGAPSPGTISLRRHSEPRYATPAFMVAPHSIECPPVSRMLSVRRKRPQPNPEEIRAAWGQYSDQWRVLLDTDPNGDHERPPLNGSRVPWPILNHTCSPVTADSIQDLLLSTVHSTDLPMKKRIREALRLYHPDRFENLVVGRIEDEAERSRVRERAGIVVRSLNALLERES